MADLTVTHTEPSARCVHFGECGGCKTQDLAYPAQLEAKSSALGALLRDYWERPIPVTPSPAIWHYRNKVDFNFARKRYDQPPPPGFVRETVLGFNRPGKWYWPLDIEECLIAPDGTAELLRAVRNWYQARDIRAYDARAKDGLLRALLVRDGKRTGERMVALITSDGPLDTAPFVQAVCDCFGASSVYRGIFRGKAQGAFADELELLYGEPYIHEELRVPDGAEHRTLRFRISPMSFFQTNSLGTEVLYGKIREYVREAAPRVVYDLYGGTGGIAFAVADLTDVVRSVENIESATRDAEANASLNGIGNVFFATADMRHFLRHVHETGGMERDSFVITDPPRSGMQPKARQRLIECGPEHILYVACKPGEFAHELPEFLARYDLIDVTAVDLFPHTDHVELLTLMRRTEKY